MNIFFDSGKHQSILLSSVINFLKLQRHKIIFEQELDEILDTKNFESIEEQKIYFKKAQKLISSCDCIILYEENNKGAGIGYKIYIAQRYNKPILIFSPEDNSETSIKLEYKGNVSKIFINENNFEKKVKTFLDNVEESKDSKFILNLSSEMNKYLAWKTKEKGGFKSRIVRRAIEKNMKKDRNWQKYLYQKKSSTSD